MPFVEQLIYGNEPGTPARRALLAQSLGLGQEVASEIRQLCEGWGDLPVGGLARPVLMSVLLKKTMSSLRGRLYAVVQMSAGHMPLFHAVVLNEADYAAFGHNPFALRQSFEFVRLVDGERPGVRGVLDPVVEVGLRRRQRLHDLPEALLLLVRQVHASQVEIPQRVGDDVAARLAGLCREMAVHPGVGLLQARIL